MRTYRWILLAGLVLLAAGWLGSMIASGPDGGPTAAAQLVFWLGQLLLVVGAAGMIMVLLVRRLLGRPGPSGKGPGR